MQADHWSYNAPHLLHVLPDTVIFNLPSSLPYYITSLCVPLQIQDWAKRFFTTLAKRSAGARGGTNPIYNLLPDVLSALSHEASLPPNGFQIIMKV